MIDPASVDGLIAELERGTSLLERLHILSQTETLALETASLTGLPAIVAAKEDVVEQIRHSEQRVAARVAEVTPFWFQLQNGTRTALRKLQDRAFTLMARIGEVEDQNRRHLERLRGEFVASLTVVRQDRRLMETYGNVPPASPHFSRLVD